MSLPNITVEVEFNQSPEGGVADTGTWTDISAYVRSGQIVRGSNSYDGVTGTYTASTALVVLDNNDARFDPTYSSSPYWGTRLSVPVGAAAGTFVLPGAKWRIRSTTGAGFTLFSGYADSWNLSYGAHGKDATCTLVGTDAVKWMAAQDDNALELAESINARIVRLLQNLGLGTTQVGADPTLLQANTSSGSYWDALQLAATSGLGEIYVDGQGRVVYRARDAYLTDSRSNTSQATFGDGGGSERPYTNITIVNDDVQLKNYINVTRAGGTVQNQASAPSLDGFSTHVLDITGILVTTDATALLYAQWACTVLAGVLNPGPGAGAADVNAPQLLGSTHIESISIDPRYDPTNLNPQVLGRELGDRITVKLRAPGRVATPLTRDCFIRGIQHTFGPESWATTWTLQDATRFNFFVFDSTTLGIFDTDFFGVAPLV